MHDNLGDRMKRFYESRTQAHLMRRSYTILRLDGKAFHSYVKGLDKPFDAGLMSDMDATAAYVCENIQGAKFGYVQSDEISILITDFETLEQQAWFDLNVQKMVSVSASLATAKFNQLRLFRQLEDTWESKETPEGFIPDNFGKLAQFDSRVFQLPTKTEVSNYFRWRQADTVRNSIASVAQSLYSAKELHGVGQNEQQELIFRRGINWNDYSSGEKRGRFIERVTRLVPVLECRHGAIAGPRAKWEAVDCPIFTQEPDFLLSRIPENN